MSFRSDRYASGEKCIWLHTPRGGYGYQVPVNATVMAVARKRILIQVLRKDGVAVQRWVKPESLCKKEVKHGRA